VNNFKIKKKEKEYSHGIMVRNMMVIGKMINNMAKDY